MQTQAPEKCGRENREGLLVPIIILTFVACAWLAYTYHNQNWIIAFEMVVAWIFNPVIYYTPLQVTGLPWAILATIEVLVLGVISAYLFLNNEKDASIKFLSALGLGFGLTGFITIILGIFGSLYQLPLNLAILLLSTILLSIIIYRKKRTQNLTVKECLTPHFSLPKFTRPPNMKFWLPACIAIGTIFFLCFYHALLTVIIHWDATVYHAAMANIMYAEHTIPVMAGPSIGIEMSANFPPLFSALGAYFYIQIGAIEDFFLRTIAPIMGLLTVLATYKIGELIAGKKFGLLSALFLTLTPLFFRYSIYATSYATLTFFCTVSILFLLLAITKGNNKYWILCGVFYGFATLTSYIALYLAPFLIIALLLYLIKERSAFRTNIKKIAILLIAIIAIGGVWYVRNYVEVGNPIYPNAYTVLGGVNIDPLIMNTTINGIKQSAEISFFGELEVSSFDKIMLFFGYRTSFPAISLLTILGLAMLPTFRNKKFWLLAIWPLSISLLVLGGISWGFPRHMVFAMPGFALLSAYPIIKALEMCKQYDICNSKNALLKITRYLPPIRKSNLIRVGLVVVLFAAFLFPSFTLVMGGKTYEENLNDQVPKDYLWFLENPNNDTWSVLDKFYPEAAAWQYINEHLNPGEKFATVENRIYYVKNCSNDYFFYLDGWEARELYNITDPALMVQFLQNQNVKCVVDVAWARTHGHFDILPMAKFLGSPYFPTIMDHSTNPNIYHVGPYETPITTGSSTMISINQDGWSELKLIDQVYTQSVIAGNDSTRLFVETPTITKVNITYLDVGNDILSINVHDPSSQEWIHDYGIIQKNGSGKWYNYEFIVPLSEQGFVELGLHAYTENFTISKIVAAPYQFQNIASLNFTNKKLTNKAVFSTLTVYLPLFNASDKIKFQTNSHGSKIGIEIYEGLIQPWETGWMHHDLVARSPPSMINGVTNPSLVLETKKPGLYTLVISVREGSGAARVDLQMSKVVPEGDSP